MAIVDFGPSSQSVAAGGPSKMIQLEVAHQDSTKHTTMGGFNGKTQNIHSSNPLKRPKPLEVMTQNKKPNLSDTSVNSCMDVSKKYGANNDSLKRSQSLEPSIHSRNSDLDDTVVNNCLSKFNLNTNEITLTRLASTSPKTSSPLDKNHHKRSTSNNVSECTDGKRVNPFKLGEISIVKVPSKKSPSSKDGKQCVNVDEVKGKEDKVIELIDTEKENCSRMDGLTDSQQDDGFDCFWNKQSLNNSRMCQASSLLNDGPKPRMMQNYTNYGSIMTTPSQMPSTENWDTEVDDISTYTFSENQKLTEDTWDSYDPCSSSQIIIQDQSNYSPDSAYGSMGDSEMSHFMLGFPNPPGENRCWLNATLHTLFATLFSLPIGDDMQHLLQHEKCSKITLMLGDLHYAWRKGGSEKTKIYNAIKEFKESLSTMERTYCSDRQQDVSEFVMALLNHLKNDFDAIALKDKPTGDQENAVENLQSSPKSTNTMVMRSSLSKLCLRSCPQRRMFSDTASSTVIDLVDSNETTKSDSSESKCSSETKKSSVTNPIDKYFLQQMVEEYTCKKCMKTRQIPIENLMVYADIPPENEASSVDLTEAIQEKTFAKEERNVICEYCKHNTQDVKTFYKEYPKVLTIQINRYGISNDGMMNKICTAVSIPEKLSLVNFLQKKTNASKTYEPICIISHVGSNMDCGHYTSYIKHDDQWFHYNDMSVMPMTSKEALTAAQSTAYLLFYVDSDLLDKPSSDCYSSRCSPIH